MSSRPALPPHPVPGHATLAARLRRKLKVYWRGLTGHREDEAELAEAANRFWNDHDSADAAPRAEQSHWRGAGCFADDGLWLRLGREHLELLQAALHRHGLPLQAERVVEWGCGGGMNAVHFARGAQAFYGIDIARASLDECGRQLARAGLAGYVPVLVDARHPHDAVQAVGEACDLFVCTYVFELLPSEAHALALLDIAHAMLRPGGVAMLQVRIRAGGLGGKSRPWDYAANMAHNVTFNRAEFSAACVARAFRILEVLDKPAVPELHEKDYAYFVLQR